MAKNQNTNPPKGDDQAPPAPPKMEIREVSALDVRSVGKSFRRLGLGFTQDQPTYLNPAALSQAQVETLKSESSLRIIGAKINVAVTEGAPESLVLVPVADAAVPVETDE
ncbi:hypothetical protein [Frateuria sp. YIM B11624]|uniref:hypothetical protein n=1 Tax=Frateuria sp. YIM B11624 TaxID=3143185 RepID=UPI003C797095